MQFKGEEVCNQIKKPICYNKCQIFLTSKILNYHTAKNTVIKISRGIDLEKYWQKKLKIDNKHGVGGGGGGCNGDEDSSGDGSGIEGGGGYSVRWSGGK